MTYKVEWLSKTGEWIPDDAWDAERQTLSGWVGNAKFDIREYCQYEANRTGRAHRILDEKGEAIDEFHTRRGGDE